MCMMVYVASDCRLPTSTRDEVNPHFYLAELTDRDEPVRRQFSKPFVYYAGSHEGCGCGFQFGQDECFEEGAAALAAARNSRRQLAEFLAVALQHQTELELFACWDGDQAALPKHRGRVRPMDLLHYRTFFREKEFLVVAAQSGPQEPRRCSIVSPK